MGKASRRARRSREAAGIVERPRPAWHEPPTSVSRPSQPVPRAIGSQRPERTAESVLESLRLSVKRIDYQEHLRDKLVVDAIQAGASWASVASALGVPKGNAHRKYSGRIPS